MKKISKKKKIYFYILLLIFLLIFFSFFNKKQLKNENFVGYEKYKETINNNAKFEFWFYKYSKYLEGKDIILLNKYNCNPENIEEIKDNCSLVIENLNNKKEIYIEGINFFSLTIKNENNCLEEIRIKKSKIISLDFDFYSTNLKIMDLISCKLKKKLFFFNIFPNLERLCIHHNEITGNITDLKLFFLEVLDISYNEIKITNEEMKEIINSMENISEIYFDENEFEILNYDYQKYKKKNRYITPATVDNQEFFNCSGIFKKKKFSDLEMIKFEIFFEKWLLDISYDEEKWKKRSKIMENFLFLNKTEQFKLLNEFQKPNTSRSCLYHKVTN